MRKLTLEPRNYKDYGCATESAKEILINVFYVGKSDGWCGSLEDKTEVENLLKPFNVVYTDDFNGRWELKK